MCQVSKRLGRLCGDSFTVLRAKTVQFCAGNRRFYGNMYNVLVNFEKDQPDPVDCAVKGNIPSWLKGSLYRNGPGLYKIGEDTFRHWFDGQATVHKYTIEGGNVRYQNRLLPTASLQKDLQANRIVVSEFGTLAYPDPCKSIFTRYFSYFFHQEMTTENNNVNIAPIGDRLFTMTETSKLIEVDKETLEIKGREDLSKYLTLHLATAHPHLDADGTAYNIGQQFGRFGKYVFFKIPRVPKGENPLDKASIVGLIPASIQGMNSYAHSFGISENFLMYVEQPYVFNGFKVMGSKFLGKSIQECLEWKDGRQTLIHVMYKSTGELLPIKFKTEPLFTFHHVNAYEEDGHLVMDLVMYPKDNVGEFVLEKLKNNISLSLPTFKRYVLPLEPDLESSENLVKLKNTTATAKRQEDGSVFCEGELFPDSNLELPRINYRKYNGKKYRYVYGFNIPSLNQGELAKLDTMNKEVTHWKADVDFLPGEPVFVPSPDGSEEDDGIILSPVSSTTPEKASFLLVLDAKTFQEIGRAEVPQDIHMPISLHGMYMGSRI